MSLVVNDEQQQQQHIKFEEMTTIYIHIALCMNICIGLNPFVFSHSIETLLVRITVRSRERKLATHYRHMPINVHT